MISVRRRAITKLLLATTSRMSNAAEKEVANAAAAAVQKKQKTADPRADRLVWVDCEMTGLDVEHNRLVEIACIISEPDLTVVAEFGPVAITHPPEVLDNMSAWCKQTFAKNGLMERIKTEGIAEKEAENQLLEFLRQYTPHGACQLAGNSVHCDRLFLCRYMPRLIAHLHYRIVDVSSIKELVRRWYGDSEALTKMPEKKLNHLALDDIRESIEELQFYRKHFFVSTPT